MPYEVAAIPGVKFETYEQAQSAVEAMKKEEQRSTATKAISRFRGGVGSSMSAMRAAKAAGPDAFATAPKGDLQKISEGQVLNERTGGTRRGLANDFGLAGNTSDVGEQFLNELGIQDKAESNAGRQVRTSVYKEKMTELNRIANMPDGDDKTEAMSLFVLGTSTPTAYNSSPEAVAQARRLAAAKTGGKIDIETNRAPNIAAATAEIERKKREAILDAERAAKTEDTKFERKKKKGDKQLVIDIADGILKDPARATGFNVKRLSQAVPGTAGYTFAQRVNNLVNKLSLEERGKMKGQGQISDFEGRMLAQSVSILSTNLRKEDFEAEIKRIKDVLNGKYQQILDGDEENTAADDEFNQLWNTP